MPYKQPLTFKNRINSFGYAFKGIMFLIRTQENMLIHLVAAILVIIAGFIFHLNITEWCLITFAIGFVFVTEAINTAIEQFIDFINPGYHYSAGKAKDLGAGAVLLSAFTAATIGILVFLPKIIALF
ncbi:MAG: diacylglycerol kinase family protein [Sphingobacteriales bacterium]|nr:diacylglycerol kinase family protein [Sphingobacteriales bacterium]